MTGSLRKLRLTIAYDGTDFCGFQRQRDQRTIQGEVEKALQRVTGETLSIVGAGRTDAGVHSLGQVAHLETRWPGPVENLRVAMNTLLPAAITILQAQDVNLEFHARYSARFRRYGYLFHCSHRGDPIRERFALRVPPTLDFVGMEGASRKLSGRRDYRGFASEIGSESLNNPVRDIQRVRWIGRGRMRLLIVQADGFLRHMMRNIVGALVRVGSGTMSLEQWHELLESAASKFEGRSAPASGLCLLRVGY